MSSCSGYALRVCFLSCAFVSSCCLLLLANVREVVCNCVFALRVCVCVSLGVVACWWHRPAVGERTSRIAHTFTVTAQLGGPRYTTTFLICLCAPSDIGLIALTADTYAGRVDISRLRVVDRALAALVAPVPVYTHSVARFLEARSVSVLLKVV